LTQESRAEMITIQKYRDNTVLISIAMACNKFSKMNMTPPIPYQKHRAV
jgi:hypothetical protein